MAKRNLRQVRYNLNSHTEDQEPLPHEWTFVLINQHQELDRIEERIYQELRRSTPFSSEVACSDETKYDLKNVVPLDNLHARYLNFRSRAPAIRRKRNIYDSGKFYKDRNLRFLTDVGFDVYIKDFQIRNRILQA